MLFGGRGNRRRSILFWRVVDRITFVLALLVLGLELATQPAVASDPPPVDEFRELMIVHPSVVDPFLNGGRSHNGGPETTGGPWSLRYLLNWLVINQQEAGKQAFYRSFFEQWLADRTADNGVVIPARDPDKVRTLLLDQFSTVDAAGTRTFQMWKVPFELMAIAYRPDLRAADGSNGGELRFVYKLVGPTGEDLKFTLIMEYKVRTNFYFPFNTLDWAHNFHKLSDYEIGSEEYLTWLQKLTWFHTTNFGASPPKLGQIRTNELAFAGSGGVWELREFKFVRPPPQTPPYMTASSVKNTPAESFNNTSMLADFIAANPALASTDTSFMSFNLPETLSTAQGPVTFLDGRSHAGVLWRIPGEPTPSVSVDNLGVLTCNGCHQDNKRPGTAEIAFYHVSPERPPGQDGHNLLSLFLTTPDPDRPGRLPGELNRRRADLQALLDQPWTPNWIQ